MKKKHIDETLTKVVEKILMKHNIQARILFIIIDNAFNNNTFFLILVQNLFAIINCVDITSKEEDENVKNDQMQNIVHVSCLAHVLQLRLQAFLKSVRVNSINDELQKN